MDSHMAGPILVKCSGIDEGNSVHVLQEKKIGVIIVNKDAPLYWLDSYQLPCNGGGGELQRRLAMFSKTERVKSH